VTKVLAEIEEYLDNVGELEEEAELSARPGVRGPLLRKVKETGGAVSVVQWREIGRRHAYDPRTRWQAAYREHNADSYSAPHREWKV
jgi:hypothetical protein